MRKPGEVKIILEVIEDSDLNLGVLVSHRHLCFVEN